MGFNKIIGRRLNVDIDVWGLKAGTPYYGPGQHHDVLPESKYYFPVDEKNVIIDAYKIPKEMAEMMEPIILGMQIGDWFKLKDESTIQSIGKDTFMVLCMSDGYIHFSYDNDGIPHAHVKIDDVVPASLYSISSALRNTLSDKFTRSENVLTVEKEIHQINQSPIISYDSKNNKLFFGKDEVWNSKDFWLVKGKQEKKQAYFYAGQHVSIKFEGGEPIDLKVIEDIA